MTVTDVLIIIAIIVAVIFVGLYYLNRWASTKMVEQDSIIEQSKERATIFVIDKTRDYAKNINLPNVVRENMPKASRLVKLNVVKAKVGPQIVTLITERDQYEALQPRKNAQVELAGMFIVSVKGQKTKKERKAIEKERKKREREERRNKN